MKSNEAKQAPQAEAVGNGEGERVIFWLPQPVKQLVYSTKTVTSDGRPRRVDEKGSGRLGSVTSTDSPLPEDLTVDSAKLLPATRQSAHIFLDERYRTHNWDDARDSLARKIGAVLGPETVFIEAELVDGHVQTKTIDILQPAVQGDVNHGLM